jgi:acyl-CoA synthetase (AMP-forming)/AMP-acid ligase II
LACLMYTSGTTGVPKACDNYLLSLCLDWITANMDDILLGSYAQSPQLRLRLVWLAVQLGIQSRWY